MPHPLVIAKLALAAVSAGAKAASPSGNMQGPTPTPNIKRSLDGKPRPGGGEGISNRDKYKTNNDSGQNNPDSASPGEMAPQQRTEQSVTTDGNGMVATGLRRPIKGTGGSFNYQDYQRSSRFT